MGIWHNMNESQNQFAVCKVSFKKAYRLCECIIWSSRIGSTDYGEKYQRVVVASGGTKWEPAGEEHEGIFLCKSHICYLNSSLLVCVYRLLKFYKYTFRIYIVHFVNSTLKT